MIRLDAKRVIVAVLMAVAAILTTVNSYRYSDSFTLLDLTLSTDQGLLSFQIPLCKLAKSGSITNDATRYSWNGNMWQLGERGGKCALRVWMTSKGIGVPNKAMFADFGYWLGSWQSSSRPGPFIVVFVPIWFVWLIGYGLFLAFIKFKVSFSIRFLFVSMTLIAVFLWAITLRTSDTT